jgi:potassium efflux system protein
MHMPRQKKQTLISVCSAIGLLLMTLATSISAAEEATPSTHAPALVTAEILESKIAEAEATAGIDETLKNGLVELYRKALSNLQAASSNRDAAQAFQEAAQNAPAETRAIREGKDESTIAAPVDVPEADLATPLSELESMLQKEKADLAAADARGADFTKRLDEEANRPMQVRQRLAAAKTEQDKVASQLKLPAPADEGPERAEARRWELETRYEALSAEIKMLDQELLSQPVRVELLEAKSDNALASIEWAGKRIKLLEELVTQKRQAEAEETKTMAEATRREAEGRHPLVVALAEQNALLTQNIADTASELDELSTRTEAADRLARQLEEDFKIAQETVAIGVHGLSEEMGHMLQEQRQTLPDVRAFQRQAEKRDEQAGAVGARRLLHRREHKRLRDPGAYVAEMLSEAVAKESPPMRKQLLDLATQRKALLEKAIESDEFYLRKLAELESAQLRLLDAIERFDAFLDEHLLWVRSASRTQLQELGALPEQVWRILSPAGWLEVVAVLIHQATHSPAFVLLALALGVLLWRRGYLIASIVAIGDKLGKPTTDRFGYSVQVLILTLIAAAAWPLVVAVTGWQLKASPEATDFSSAVGEALLAVAANFYFLRAFFLICMPQGLAAAHFRWTESSLGPLRSALNQLSWIFLPASAVAIVAFLLDPLNAGWAVGRTSFLIMVASLAFALYRLLHPKSGVLAAYLGRPDNRIFRRLHRLWYPALVIAPLALGVLSVMGYLYTAGTLLALLVETIWLVAGLVILAALAQRWLRVTRRRLVYEAAMERRQALLERKQQQEEGQEAEDSGALEIEEEVDLEELTDTSSSLFNTAIVIAGLVGLWMIWSEVFPAFRVFDDIALWHQTVTVAGEEHVRPVTLADIGLALIYLVVTVVLAKQLPAMLEILLLDYSEMSAGSRYTVTTLTTYTVITVGIMLVFGVIGVDWSKLQWLIAALGVGIGFGLQEIVANFISGIILLFERPIRIGDVVTVENTDGVVTRIRIRATTIRNHDGKELLVPNKAFITGNLLNWSLSDQTTRILISVGIAYGSDVREAMRLLEEAARENEVVLDDPAPSVIFQAFADSSLTMLLRCFVDSVDVRFPTISALNQAINDKFNAAGIVIAFPQRDLHLDTNGRLHVTVDGVGQAPSGAGK